MTVNNHKIMEKKILLLLLIPLAMLGCKEKQFAEEETEPITVIEREQESKEESMPSIELGEKEISPSDVAEMPQSDPTVIAQITQIVKDSLIDKAKMINSNNEIIIANQHITRWQYPRIKLNNADFTKTINQKIQSLVVSLGEGKFNTVAEHKLFLQKENSKALNSKASDEDYEYVNSQLYYSDYKVSVDYNAHNILELVTSYTTWYGGVFDYGGIRVLYNTATGKQITFEDCFLPAAEPIILQQIKKQLKQNYKAENSTLEKITLNRIFGIGKGGITYNYNKYEVTYGYLGAPEINIPFSLLNDYIKDNGPLAVFKK